MGQFRKCMEDDNLQVLIAEGVPTPEQLAEAWATLFLEYCDLAEASEATYRIRLQAKIFILKRKLEICQAWIDIITVVPSHEIIAALRLVGYEYDFDHTKPELYIKDLERVNAELRLLRFDIRVKEAEYQAIEKTPSVNDTVDKKYFSTIYTRINNYCKYNAVNDQTSVEMFCAALRDLVGSVEEPKQVK